MTDEEKKLKDDVMCGKKKLVPKDWCIKEIETNPNNYIWIDGEPYPINLTTAAHFKIVDKD